ncbi:lysophospholipid acyltransferase family protein [Nocardia thailandica]
MVFDAPPATATAHPWMPSSPCGCGCLTDIDQVSPAVAVARAAGIAGLLVSYPAFHVLTPRARRGAVQRRYARAVLSCLGMRLRVVDKRVVPGRGYAEPDTGVLVVAGHIGWIDVVAMAGVQPLGFVARADLIDWPVLGRLAAAMRVIPIDREKLRQLPGVVAQVADRLAAGERVAAFPEGTTWCGRAYGRMRPAMFQAAVDARVPVQPVRVRYLDADGAQSTVGGFVGEDSFGDSVKRLLLAKGLVAEITLAPVEHSDTDRHTLAERCEQAIRGTDRAGRAAARAGWIAAAHTRVQDPGLVEAPTPAHP